MTFINKMDRDVRPALELIDEIESALGMAAAPFTWPIGMGREFRGVLDLRTDAVMRYGEDEVSKTVFDEAMAEVELVRGAGHRFDREAYLSGKQTPVFFGSALNDFGVKEVLDALVDHAPAPGSRPAFERTWSSPPRRPSPAWCSRSRRTWTRDTATASPSCACARGASSAACV